MQIHWCSLTPNLLAPQVSTSLRAELKTLCPSSLSYTTGSAFSHHHNIPILWETLNQRPPSPAMNPSCQPAPGVMGVFKTSFSGERVGGGTRYRRDPRRWALTSTTQHLIYRLVQRSKPLVLQRGRNVIYMYWCFVFLIFVWYKQTINVPFPVVWRQPGWNSLLDMLFLWHSWRHTRQGQRLTSSYAVYSTVCLWERSESEVQLININSKMTECVLMFCSQQVHIFTPLRTRPEWASVNSQSRIEKKIYWDLNVVVASANKSVAYNITLYIYVHQLCEV